VYALGVLLFELLSSRHPTASAAHTPAVFVKAVADTDPRRLSAAVENADGNRDIAAVAADRATTPDRLRRALRGDLDVVLATALKTRPEERYGSVVEFADDLRRVLENQPISARRDSFGYRAARFARRHRGALALTAAAVTLLITLTAFYTVRLSSERDRARAQALKASRASELVMGLLESADPYRSPADDELTVQNLLDSGARRVSQQLAGEPELQAQLLTVIGRTYERSGDLDKAGPLLEQALAAGRASTRGDSAIVAQTLNDLGVLKRQLGDLGASEPLLRESLAVRRRLLGDGNPDVAITLVELSRTLRDAGRLGEAEPLAQEALDIRRTAFGDEHRETATSKSDLGLLLLSRGDLRGAERLLRENAETTERLLGANHPNTASAKASLASVMLASGDATGAERLLREAVRVNLMVFGADRPEYAQMLNSLAGSLEAQGRLQEAEPLLDESLRIAEPRFGADHPRVLTYTINRARVRLERGHAAGTEEVLRRVLATRQRLLRPGDWRIAQAQSLLGAALIARRQLAEAEPLMLEADRALNANPGAEGDERRANRERLVRLYTGQGRADRADVYR
jgi:tetratricopeptide (TPR) repeat protein